MVRAPHFEMTGLKKGAWTLEEDRKLAAYINKYGIWNWREMPKYAGLLRCGKSCRLRWMNYLRPDIKHGSFSKEEEETILQLHKALGNKWSTIATKLPGRTDNEIKNYWHTRFKKNTKNNPEFRIESEEPKKVVSLMTDLPLPSRVEVRVSESTMDTPKAPCFPIEDCSPSCIDSTVGNHEFSAIEINKYSSKIFGELDSFWTQPFLLEDWYFENVEPEYVDPIYLQFHGTHSCFTLDFEGPLAYCDFV